MEIDKKRIGVHYAYSRREETLLGSEPERFLMAKRILFISHSASFAGGSILSLKYTVEALDRKRFTPIVASISNSPELIQAFKNIGVEAFFWPGISIFPHTTGGWFNLYSPVGLYGFSKSLLNWHRSVRSTESLLAHVKPDIVHLNSVVLSPSAWAVKKSKAKLVWHIRESVVQGHFGLRKKAVSWMVKTMPNQSIFISNYDRDVLNAEGSGAVIPNFVDFKKFDRNSDSSAVRKELGLQETDKVILFLGGFTRLKGAPVLLKALYEIIHEVPSAKAIIAGAIRPTSPALHARFARASLPLLGMPTERQVFYEMINRLGLSEHVILLPFRPDPDRLIAASDVVVFPSTEPHFARPVIEAGAMGKPVVASNIGGVAELVEDGKTGVLVPPKNSGRLAEAIVMLFRDEKKTMKFAQGGYQKASREFDSKTNIQRITAVYENLVQQVAD